MAIGTLGTNTTTSLKATAAWATSLSDADIAAIAAAITPDSRIAAILAGFGAGATGVLTTGVTHTNTTLDTLVSTAGGPLATIAVGDLVLAADVPPGTFVVAKPTGTSVTLSQAATGGNAERVAFVRPNPPGLTRAGQQLVIPKRGVLQVLPGDIVAVDNTGWPILVSGAAIGYAGTQWNLV